MPARATPPVLAFALWPLVRACPGPRSGGQPHPDAADPWGEDHAADLLTDYEPEEVGPFLTVTASAPGAVGRPSGTCRVVFAGDATEALLGYAARVARDTGHPPFEGSAVEQAREAFGVAVDELTHEFGAEAVREWEYPDPDTWRNARRMPESTRAALRTSAEAEAHRVEAEALDAHLCEALGITNDGPDAAAPAPLPLAA
ncbi:hypothetical protein RQM47_15925 [Rubrivirga sp. S365]|uniref:hypothetical protein n=1 Tax=Rubrivirga sp. S365 TaxID=3076080 RepID=UPI0028CA3AB4|nr:hypothetical protein [Rubrivirga sp. S365]MDT7858136.1 hypothetical protein [Rubrivirga sp. S365]